MLLRYQTEPFPKETASTEEGAKKASVSRKGGRKQRIILRQVKRGCPLTKRCFSKPGGNKAKVARVMVKKKTEN